MSEEQSGTVTQEAQPAEVVEEVVTEEVQPEEGEASGEPAASGEGTPETPEGEKETPAQERIRELANLRREAENRAKALEQRLAEVEHKFSTTQVEQTIDVNALNAHLGKMRDEIDFLRIDGKHLEADLKEQERNALITEYKEWQKQDAERRQRVQTEQQSAAQKRQMLQKFDDACVFLAKESQIPDEAFAEMGTRFQKLVEADKVFARELLETLEYQGPIRAANLVHQRIKSDMAAEQKAVEDEKKRREDAKKKTITAGGTDPEGKVTNPDKLSMDEWLKWRNEQLKK